MVFDLDNYLGLHEQALKVRTDRNTLIASNIANADTPRYQARDIDFRAVLGDYMAGRESHMSIARTRPGHFSEETAGADAPGVMYRVPMQPSLDGNTVESDVEIAEFAENAVRYQSTLRFISGRIAGLRDAITGGR